MTDTAREGENLHAIPVVSIIFVITFDYPDAAFGLTNLAHSIILGFLPFEDFGAEDAFTPALRAARPWPIPGRAKQGFPSDKRSRRV
jgi:hypothetical protein